MDVATDERVSINLSVITNITLSIRAIEEIQQFINLCCTITSNDGVDEDMNRKEYDNCISSVLRPKSKYLI